MLYTCRVGGVRDVSEVQNLFSRIRVEDVKVDEVRLRELGEVVVPYGTTNVSVRGTAWRGEDTITHKRWLSTRAERRLLNRWGSK